MKDITWEHVGGCLVILLIGVWLFLMVIGLMVVTSIKMWQLIQYSLESGL